MATELQEVNQRANGTAPVDTDLVGVDRLMGGGGYTGRYLSWLALRTALATIWDGAISTATSSITSAYTSAIAAAVSGLATAASVTAAIATALGYVRTADQSIPSRVIGTAFQPSATKVVEVRASFALRCQSLLVGTAEVKVELLSDASNPPTTVRDTVANRVSGVLNVDNTQTSSLNHRVKPGDYVLYKATVVSGTASATIVSQSEVTGA